MQLDARTYAAWFKLGHADHPNEDICIKCEISYDDFAGTFKTCDESLADTEIERKKLIEQEQYRPRYF